MTNAASSLHCIQRLRDVKTLDLPYLDCLRRNALATVTLCGVFWTFGLSVGFLGPTLWDLECLTGSALSSSTWLFLAQLSAMLAGNLLAGQLLKRMPADCLSLFGVCVIAIAMALVPACSTLFELAAVLAIMGLNMGFLDTSGNVAIVGLYKDMVSPFLQALHFFYGFGAFVSPILVEMFLDNENCDDLLNSTNTTTLRSHEVETLGHKNLLIRLHKIQHNTSIKYAFCVMAALQLPIIILLCATIVKRKRNAISICVEEGRVGKADASCCCCVGKPLIVIWILLFTGSISFCSDGLQAVYSGYVFTYAKMSAASMKSELAAELDAAFWGAFTVGRLVAVFLAFLVPASAIVLIDMTGIALALLLQVLFTSTQTTLFAGAIAVGFFLASISPAVLTWTQQITTLEASAISCLVVIAALGELVFPQIAGTILATKTPIAFLDMGIGTVIVMLVAYVAAWSLYRMRLKRNGDTEESYLLGSGAS